MSKYFVIEGPDGAGKTTLLQALTKELEKNRQVGVFKHPGSTLVGDEIRLLVKNRSDVVMTKYTEQVLMAADYAEFVQEVLQPLLERDVLCVSDRCNLISGMIYGVAGKVQESKIVAFQNITMALTMPPINMIVLNAPYEELLKRRHHDEVGECKFESRDDDYHRNVVAGYVALTDTESFIGRRAAMMAEKICCIDAMNSEEVVLQRALDFVEELLGD